MEHYILAALQIVAVAAAYFGIKAELKSHFGDKLVITKPALKELGLNSCDICSGVLPKGAVRTHDGKWRCSDHKDK